VQCYDKTDTINCTNAAHYLKQQTTAANQTTIPTHLHTYTYKHLWHRNEQYWSECRMLKVASIHFLGQKINYQLIGFYYPTDERAFHSA